MLTYCLKCKKNAENVDSKMFKTQKTVKQLYSQNALYLVVKNQDL